MRHRRRSSPASDSRRARPSQARSRAAAALVEFAIVANVLFLIVFTCVEFARINMVRNLTQDAAYFAARHAVVPGATADEAVQQARRIMSSMVGNDVDVDVSPLDSTSEEVVVTVAVAMNDVALFTPMFVGNKTISATASMRTERYTGFYQQ